MKVLVTYRDNYADEFDVNGFKIYEADIWYKLIENLRKVSEAEDIAYWFGTNEGIEYNNVEDFLKRLKVGLLTLEMETTILTFFPEASTYGYGLFPSYTIEGEN